MKDFNLAKYLKEHNLGSHGILGNYIDLQALKEEVDNTVTIELDMSWEPQFDAYAKQIFDDFNIQVKETDKPGTYEVTGRKEDILGYLRSEFYEMDEESIQQYYPELLDDEMNEGEPEGDQYDGEYDSQFGPAIANELEKPENIYADDEDRYTGSLAPSDDRMMDIGGDQIEQGIISLLDDGFEPEDILEACKMLIDAQVNAAMQSKKF
jgi:hypothetical protein